MHLTVVEDEAALGHLGAQLVADGITEGLTESGRAAVAFSGGRTPQTMLETLATRTDVDWPRVDVFQVDERVAPAGHADRNLGLLATSLLDRVDVGAMHPMPVEDNDLGAAAVDYEQQLPGQFDVIVLGLGDDGHTASLVPGDPVLDIADRAVAITAEYRGHRRMTLTFPALDRARLIVWLISGTSKQCALAQMLSGDRTVPASRVPRNRAHVLVDAAAADRGDCEG